MDQNFDTVGSQRSLVPSEPPAPVSWQDAGAYFHQANQFDSGRARAMISSVHSSTFHSSHSGFPSSTFNAPAYGNSQAIYTHAGSSLQAPVTNPSSGAFQPFNKQVYAPAPYYVGNHVTNAPFAGHYSPHRVATA